MATKLVNAALGSKVKIKVGGATQEFVIVNHGQPSDKYESVWSNYTVVWLRDTPIYGLYDKHCIWIDSTSACFYEMSNIHPYLTNTFMGQLDRDIQDLVKTVKVPYYSTASTGEQSGALTVKAFILSTAELGFTGGSGEGSKFGYFNSGDGADYKRACPTIIATSYWTRSIGLYDPGMSGLRPYVASSTGALALNEHGMPGSYHAVPRGICPALVFSSDLYIDDDGYLVKENPNKPPTAPGAISHPASVNAWETSNITFTWGAATDPNGDSIIYIPEINTGGGWSRLASISTRSHTHTIGSSESTVQLRVKASDGELESGYTTSGVVTIKRNTAPTTPGTVSYSVSEARGGKSITMTWPASHDAEGDTIKYYVERRVDSGNWIQLDITTATTVTDTVPTSGARYQVRVKAVDTKGAESAYSTGAAIPMRHNDPPTISGSDTSLGDLTSTGLRYNYTVKDDNDSALTVTESLNGIILTSSSVPVDVQRTVTLSTAIWQRLLNTTHTLVITATDSEGLSVTRTVTFIKDEKAIEFKVKPRATGARARRVTLVLSGIIPSQAELTVYACNNGNDANPTWENITTEVKTGRAYVFQNTAKTASAWGLGIHLILERGMASACYITAMTVGYDTDTGTTATVAALSETVDTLMTDILPGLDNPESSFRVNGDQLQVLVDDGWITVSQLKPGWSCGYLVRRGITWGDLIRDNITWGDLLTRIEVED